MKGSVDIFRMFGSSGRIVKDFRDFEKSAVPVGCVLKDAVDSDPRTGNVVPQDIFERCRMSGRFDVCGVQLAEFFDIRQDIAQLPGELPESP